MERSPNSTAVFRMSNLCDMKLFSAVVETGGFRPAAQRLGLPASTVSDVVRRLEERLGLRLLNRSTRGVMPTDAGRCRPPIQKIRLKP